MSFTAVYWVVVGASVVALTLLYLTGRRKPSAAKPAPPRWHKHFDDPA
jgi:hypothetical protein